MPKFRKKPVVFGETACERGECEHNSPKTCAKTIARAKGAAS